MSLTDTQILELRTNRAKKVREANELLKTAQTEKRDLSSAEAEKFDKLHSEAEQDLKTIEREERQASANRTIVEPASTQAGGSTEIRNDTNGPSVEVRNAAIEAWCRAGINDLPAEQRQVMQSLFSVETRALSAGTTTAGGYTVAPDTSMYASIVEGLKDYGFDESIAEVLNTGNGADLPIPTNNDTANSGALIGENTDVSTATDPAFGQIVVKGYLFTSRELPVSIVLLQDSAIDVDSYIGKLLGQRLGRTTATYLTTGTGVTQPQGVVTASAAGVTAASASAITYNELLDLIHSVDPAHRRNARFMFKDSTLKVLKKLVDSQGRPLFLPGYAVREPDTINGYAYSINQEMATIAANAKSVLFGDFKKFLIRKVKGFTVQRLVERRAEFGQVSFLGFLRMDSKLLDAGTNPIKHLVQAAA